MRAALDDGEEDQWLTLESMGGGSILGYRLESVGNKEYDELLLGAKSRAAGGKSGLGAASMGRAASEGDLVMASMPAPDLNAWKTDVTGVAGDATPTLFESKIEDPHEDLSFSGCAPSLRHVGSELAPAGPACENVQN